MVMMKDTFVGDKIENLTKIENLSKAAIRSWVPGVN